MDNDALNILVVEDDEADFLLLKEILSHDDYRYCLQQSVSIADSMVKLEDSDYDVILLDLSLPDSFGLESLDSIMNKNSKTPVIILTGHEEEAFGLKAVSKGAQDYLIKGQFENKDIRKSIIYALERSKLQNFKDEIINNISHELRTPLTIIRESISQIKDGIIGDVNEKQITYLDRCLKNITRQRKIIDDLLDISKLESGKLELFKSYTNLSYLCDEIVKSFQPQFENKELKLELTLPEEEIIALIDCEKISQVLINIIGNAFKFTEEGKVEVILEIVDQEIVCHVKDSGVGIHKKDIDKVFEKFDQINRLAGPGEKGTGLGLPITRGIVELHRGKISVDSQIGEGTTFTFTLPYLGSFNTKIPLAVLDKTKDLLKDYSNLLIIVINFDSIKNKDALGMINKSILSTLYRDKDETIISGDLIFIFLPNTQKKNLKTILARISDSFQESSKVNKIIKNIELEHYAVQYPKNGVTEDELLTNLMSKLENL